MNSPSNTHTQSVSRWHMAPPIAWIVYAAVLTLIQVAGLIAAFRQLPALSLSPQQMEGLQAMGLSAQFYSAWRLLWQMPLPLAWGGLGLVIFIRRPRDRGTFVLSAMMVGIGMATSIPTWQAFAADYPQWTWIVPLAAFIGNLCIYSFFFVFPTGRYVPRWTPVLAIGLSAFNILNSYQFALPSDLVPLARKLDWFFPFFGITTVAGSILAPLYRYRRVSSRVEQEQIKWVVFAIVSAVAIFGLTASTVFIMPDGNPETNLSFTTVFIQQIGWDGSLLLIPFSIGMAILRYRLFDIDVIIRRTLVYGVLTAMLALVYFGSISLLQSLLSAVGGPRSELVIIISTLAIAALFNPLHRRVQNAIDHRFYRRKYDAQKVLAQFAATARDEVQLERLGSELVGVVQETMRPEQLALLLLNPKRTDRRTTP